LIEVLRHIHARAKENLGDPQAGLETAKAARERIFGFELLPAPYVVAHLQLNLALGRWQAGFDHAAGERAAVFLTNALTGWEPPREPKHLLFPEFEQERDAADHVKREERILVILGNPPYDGFAGIAASTETDNEERRLSKAYREVTTPGLPKPQGQGLNDLYVRFYRMAERRIVEHTGEGIVCFISNYSWLDGLSHPGMRERFLAVFDRIAIDCLNGDKFKTGKRTPEGKPDPSVFSTPFNREGIQVGTAIATLVRRKHEAREASADLAFRHFWGTRKREELLTSLDEDDAESHEQLAPNIALGLPFVPLAGSSAYFRWKLITELIPISFPGVKTSRDDALVDTDLLDLRKRMVSYFDSKLDEAAVAAIAPTLLRNAARFNGTEVRQRLLRSGIETGQFLRYDYRPFDVRWLYWHPETKLLDEKRSDYVEHIFAGNDWLFTTGRTRKNLIEPPITTSRAADLNLMDSGARGFPLLLNRSAVRENSNFASQVLETLEIGENINDAKPIPNLTPFARKYLARFSCKAANLFHHTIAVLHAPAYREENAGALRQDWPRIPLPESADVLRAGAALGRELAALLDPETPVPGVTSGNVREELRGRPSFPPNLPKQNQISPSPRDGDGVSRAPSCPALDGPKDSTFSTI
jgi:predicted helicase